MSERKTLSNGDLVQLDDDTWAHAVREPDNERNGKVFIQNSPTGILVEKSGKHDDVWVVYVSKLEEKFLIDEDSIRKVSD